MQILTNTVTLTSLTALAPDLKRFGLNQQNILNFGLEAEMAQDAGKAGGVAVLSDLLQEQGEPLGELLAYRHRLFEDPDNREIRQGYEECLTGLVRRVLTAHQVPNGLVGVSMDHGLKLTFNIQPNTSSADKQNVLSAVSELTNSGLALLSEKNEQGDLVRQMGPQRMVRIPEGRFVMGAADFEDAPPHWVEITQPYWLGETALTEGAWRLFDLEGGNPESDALYPATKVSWDDAQACCKLLNTMIDGADFCLPTEAPWERGARGPAVNMRKWMEQNKIREADFEARVRQRDAQGRLIGVMENFYEEVGGPIYNDLSSPGSQALLRSGRDFFGSPMFATQSGALSHKEAYYGQKKLIQVGRYPGNLFGLRDMTGGVWEWVKDWYDETSYGDGETMRQDPRGPENGDDRSLRGGSWFSNHPDCLRVAFRLYSSPGNRGKRIGIRLAAALEHS